MIAEKIINLFITGTGTKAHPEIADTERKNYSKYRPPDNQAYACYAPLKNMYFGHEGKVVACCFNRDHILGNYPAQSIKEMWLGDKAEQLRQRLKDYDFSLGCQSCEKKLAAGNFDGAGVKQYDPAGLNENKFPSVLEFELDDTCNLECLMCSGNYSSLIRAKREKRPPRAKHYDDEFIRQLEEFIPHLEEVRFLGGEPFLVPIYFKIWDKMIELNPAVRIVVTTNGTTLNSRVKEIMQKTNFLINISIDSLKKDSYEKIRVNSNFESVMKNLEYFHSYCFDRGTHFGITVCIMRQNWFEAPDFIRFCNGLNAPVFFNTVYEPDFASLKELSKAELQEIHFNLSSKLDEFPDDTYVRKKNKKHYQDFLSQILEWGRKPEPFPEITDIKSFEQLKDFISRRTFERKDISEEQKIASLEKIMQNLEYLKSVFPPELSVSYLLKHVDPRDDNQIREFLESGENMQKVQIDDSLTHLLWTSRGLMRDKK